MSAPVIAWKPAAPTPELASARLRCFRPMEFLSRAGWHCELFDDAQMHRYRIVVFQKAYGEHDLELAAHLKSLGVRTVFDLCDNHFYNPTGRPDYRERADRLRRMIGRADAVTVATGELGALIDRPTVTIDDALDTVEHSWWSGWRRRWRRAGQPFRIVWFGNAGLADPPFGLIDLERIRPQLETLHQWKPLRLTVISNSREAFERRMSGTRFPIRYRDWDNARYQRVVRRNDLCVIPVGLNPFTRCKTVNRLALSLLLGVPAAVDGIPSYVELRSFALFDDWVGGLIEYVRDSARRRRDVRRGRKYLRQTYTPQRVVEQWSAVLRPLAA